MKLLNYKKILFAFLILVIFIIVYFLPVWKIKEIKIQGNESISEKQILSSMNLKEEISFSRVNSNQIAKNLLSIKKIKKVEVKKKFPSTINIKIFERTPIAYISLKEGDFLIDEEGVDFDKKGRVNYPHIVLLANENFTPVFEESMKAEEKIQIALKVISAIKEYKIPYLSKITIDYSGYIEVFHKDSKISIWGFDEDLKEKAKSLSIIYNEKGRYYNISNYKLPTVKN